jgi:type 1 fimbria pilin
MTARALRSMTFAAAALVALTMTACGASTVSTSNFSGEAKAVAQRISDFQTDATGQNEQKLCQVDLASVVLTRLRAAGGKCEPALKTQLGEVDVFELKVESIAVTGKKASARVKSTWSGKSAISTLQLVKEGGAWKIAALA